MWALHYWSLNMRHFVSGGRYASSKRVWGTQREWEEPLYILARWCSIFNEDYFYSLLQLYPSAQVEQTGRAHTAHFMHVWHFPLRCNISHNIQTSEQHFRVSWASSTWTTHSFTCTFIAGTRITLFSTPVHEASFGFVKQQMVCYTVI